MFVVVWGMVAEARNVSGHVHAHVRPENDAGSRVGTNPNGGEGRLSVTRPVAGCSSKYYNMQAVQGCPCTRSCFPYASQLSYLGNKKAMYCS